MDFYDMRVDQAGAIAQQYKLSVSDVLSLLMLARENEGLVREALEQSVRSDEAKEAQRHGRMFDVVAHAHVLLQQRMNERGDRQP